MPTLAELTAARSELEAAINAAKQEVVAGIKTQMAAAGLTLADIGAAPRVAAKRPVKYRNEKGETWLGIGQRPRWLRAALAAGKTLDEFKVK